MAIDPQLERISTQGQPAAAEAEAEASPPEKHGVGEYFGDVLQARMARRSFLKGAGAAGAALVVSPTVLAPAEARAGVDPGRRLRFEPLEPNFEDRVIVAEGHEVEVLIRWGDPLFPGAPDFDPAQQTGARQSQQFGYNCDFLGFFALPFWLKRHVERFGRPRPLLLWWLGLLQRTLQRSPARHALLCVNHEYTRGGDMFPAYDATNPTRDQVETEIEAHGHSVVEIRRQPNGSWRFVKASPFNRRITGTTEIELAGPLAGHDLVKTSADPSGRRVQGMFNNCSGGKTPWGTVLTCEENFDQYFANFDALIANDLEKANLYRRVPAPPGESSRKWERFDSRFDLSVEPNEYARFGYVIEFDPFDPGSTPRKHTALGRFKHEGAAPVITRDGRVAVYSGDDARFEYVYKFVSRGQYNPFDRAGNMELLEEGTLFVARFHADGTGEWLPLVHGEGPLTAANGFPSQAEVLINTRGAADAVGATAMDRPEDIEVSPATGKVYVALTNNTRRNAPSGNPGEDAANPRTPNPWGHIIEITEDGDDNGATSFRWEIFMLCGDPRQGHDTFFAGFDPSQVSPIAAPDNLVFDKTGNLWISTDGQPFAQDFGWNDGVFAVPTEGPDRGFLRQFLSGVPAGECASLDFSTDDKALVVSIQHPGERGGFPNTLSAWPEGNAPARPSVVVAWNARRRRIGS